MATDGSGRSVLVTGASRGLGLEIALEVAAAGFSVWAGYRSDRHVSLMNEAARSRGVALRPIRLDVTGPASISAAKSKIEGETGGLFGLVNNAGITLKGCFEDTSEAEVARVLETNLFGTMSVIRTFVPSMRRAGRGRIVTLTSVAGRLGQVGLASYAASKFALEGLCESLWLELKPFGIDVVIVEPGIVATDIWNADNIATGALDPGSAYSGIFEAAESQRRRMVNSSRITANHVARCVLQSLTVRRPRLRYVVGPVAKLLLFLRRHMPGDSFDRLYLANTVRMSVVSSPNESSRPGIRSTNSSS